MEKERQLRVEFPHFNVKFDEDEDKYVFHPDDPNKGWVSILGEPGAFWYENKIDLSGYSLQEKTIYPRAVICQENQGYVNSDERPPIAPSTTDIAQGTLIAWDFISSIPIDIEDIWVQAIAGNLGPYFGIGGFLGGSDEWTALQYGRFRHYIANQTLSGMSNNPLVCVVDNTFGSMQPTASDVLYCYRMVMFDAVPTKKNAAVFCPPMRLVIPSDIGTEDDLEYMMRLKRSYELANQQ